MNKQLESDWDYLPLIKSVVALSALFHDWGKASKLFQNKLKASKRIGDPLRHEWISALFLKAFIGKDTDAQWLARLADGKIDVKQLKSAVKDIKKPLEDLSPAASLVVWLVVSHHRLPAPAVKHYKEVDIDFKDLLALITQKWGYENKFHEKQLDLCFKYPQGLPSASSKWMTQVKKHAQRLLEHLPLLEEALDNGSWRLILQYSRLALMLGDHQYSSQAADLKWGSTLKLYANTDDNNVLKQKLDEHLCGVAASALTISHLLPAFESNDDELQHVYNLKALKQKSDPKYKWQDKAVSAITQWRDKQENHADLAHFGFFAVNMASTGTGKTFANAKIMQALSPAGDSLRYILALGLRTLTLQTGDEYRRRIGLEKDELAVLIGSRAVQFLHDNNQSAQSKDDKSAHFTGSESSESLMTDTVDFESDIPKGVFSTVLKSAKQRQFLFAPVLSCTIDHLMAATETTRGGRYILPTLRLMSSDLVIDEIDDFDGDDLIAIGRLIHLAGMLGRKVMISSATIPPDLAIGYYKVYQAGWAIFAAMRQRSPVVGCAWIDEFDSDVQDIDSHTDYTKAHQNFIDKRLKKLAKEGVKRKADIIPCPLSDETDIKLIQQNFHQTIQAAILEKHQQHHVVDKLSQKRVSFGLVRIANITPCIALTRYLLQADFPDNIVIRTMAYHSQQLLIMRNQQEKHLDAVLNRQNGAQVAFAVPEIRQHLEQIDTPDVIFILVATAVEEVGRDHDFDWAVVEPSSYRSFVQLAGRVLRHRKPVELALKSANIALLQYNLRGLKKEDQAFCYPGYESKENALSSHDLTQLLDESSIAERLDARYRISKRGLPDPASNLAALEHHCIAQLLNNDKNQGGPESMQGWLSSCWWLTAMPQLHVRFRASHPNKLLYLIPNDKDEWEFVGENKRGKIVHGEGVFYRIAREELDETAQQRLWLQRDYQGLLRDLIVDEIHDENKALTKKALIYGEISLPVYNENKLHEFNYSNQLGLGMGKSQVPDKS